MNSNVLLESRDFIKSNMRILKRETCTGDCIFGSYMIFSKIFAKRTIQ